MRTDPFEFKHEGRTLHGIVSLPDAGTPRATVVFVHGHGKTNVVAGDWYADLCRTFCGIGLACCAWDKPGCGRSEGHYDHNQTVQNSAHEVVAAMDELDSLGHDRIGFWGISRAGWICPLAIGERPDVAFWISVSGPDGEDNFRYLLETNLRIEGRSEVETRRLVAEFQNGFDSCRKGRPYAEYLSATAGLNRDPFFLEVLGGPWTEGMYRREQAKYIAGQYQVNEESGLVIFVPAFRETLMKVQCPVLAIFGEKDTNVDWRKTMRLYRETIGSRPHADLTIRTFPDGNHGIMPCETGGVCELTRLWPMQQYCDGYHRVMSEWVKVRLADEAVNP